MTRQQIKAGLASSFIRFPVILSCRTLTEYGLAAKPTVVLERACSAAEFHVAQHETGAARMPDAVAEIVGSGTRVGADTHLIEQATATAPHHRTQEAWVLVADDRAQAL